jgi:O-antigen/teichoic acid export membrane protein
VSGIAVGATLVFEGYGVGGYLAGLAICSLAIGTVGLAVAWPRHPRRENVAPAHPSLARWLRYGIPVSMAATFAWALSFIDRYMIAILKSVDAAGVYFLGNALGDRFVMVPMFAFAAAANPLLVTAFEHHGRAEVERLLRAYTRVILLVSIPCVGYVYAAAWPLVKVFAGLNYVRYATATTVAPIVAIGSLLYGLGGLAAVGLAVQRRMRYLILSTALGLIVNVAANLVLIPLYGVIGAAIAVPISTGVYLGATAWWSRPYAHWSFPMSTLVRAVIATVIGIVIAKMAINHFHWQVVQALVAAGVGLVAYAGALLVLGERAHGRKDSLARAREREHAPTVEKP